MGSEGCRQQQTWPEWSLQGPWWRPDSKQTPLSPTHWFSLSSDISKSNFICLYANYLANPSVRPQWIIILECSCFTLYFCTVCHAFFLLPSCTLQPEMQQTLLCTLCSVGVLIRSRDPLITAMIAERAICDALMAEQSDWESVVVAPVLAGLLTALP